MTKQQIELIKRLIEAERYYWERRLNGELVTEYDRMVEVGRINGINSRTARSLDDMDLIDGFANEMNQWWIRLK